MTNVLWVFLGSLALWTGPLPARGEEMASARESSSRVGPNSSSPSNSPSKKMSKLRVRIPRCRNHCKDLLTPALATVAEPTAVDGTPVAVPLAPTPPAVVESETAAPKSETRPPTRPRPRVDWEGLVIGDYHIQPTITLGTDNRYDDANTRERAVRRELDELAMRRDGEVHRDPLTTLILERVRPEQLRTDPGFQLATTINTILKLQCTSCAHMKDDRILMQMK